LGNIFVKYQSPKFHKVTRERDFKKKIKHLKNMEQNACTIWGEDMKLLIFDVTCRKVHVDE